MTLGSYFRLFSPRAVALAALVGLAGPVAAADVAAPTYAAPAFAPAVGAPAADCPTCHGGGGAGGCANCPKRLFHNRPPYTPHLCPGACFGYFQTQWHRWENVCPLPYQGVGLSDAPRPGGNTTPPAPGATGPKTSEKGSSDTPLPTPKPLPPGTPGTAPAPAPAPAPLPVPMGTTLPKTVPSTPMPVIPPVPAK